MVWPTNTRITGNGPQKFRAGGPAQERTRGHCASPRAARALPEISASSLEISRKNMETIRNVERKDVADNYLEVTGLWLTTIWK